VIGISGFMMTLPSQISLNRVHRFIQVHFFLSQWYPSVDVEAGSELAAEIAILNSCESFPFVVFSFLLPIKHS
jgi:hypothetical protein